VIAAGSTLEQPLPADTEARLASFTELMATAIANAESRAALAASRARIVAAADETRRRIERDLHDGTQQHLVTLMLELRAVQATAPTQLGELEDGLSRIAEGLAGVFDRVREISHGIHQRSCLSGGWSRRSRRWRAGPRCRWSWICVPGGCPGWSRWRRITRCRRRWPTPPSTRTRPSCRLNSTHATRSCGWRSAMTGSGSRPCSGVGTGRAQRPHRGARRHARSHQPRRRRHLAAHRDPRRKLAVGHVQERGATRPLAHAELLEADGRGGQQPGGTGCL
jgi:hypothetical protein